jgi:hypothetical protein
MGRRVTPIERIFRKVVGRKMTANERRILLGETGKSTHLRPMISFRAGPRTLSI